MINFYLPDFYEQFKLNYSLILLLREHPEYFIDGLRAGAVYGSYPGAIWNGGRLYYGSTSNDNIINTTAAFNELDVPLRFTFTNNQLLPRHFYDNYCNLIMELCNNDMNEVLVNDIGLENYIRMNYPNYKIIASTTKCERNIEEINKFTKRYNLVVLDYNDNHNEEFLNKINDVNKIELLINAYCYPNCQHRKEHYTQLSKDQLNYSCGATFQCDAMKHGFYDILDFPTIITPQQIQEYYIPKGFQHFKIEGRTLHPVDILESYIYYLVKDEYKDKVRYKLLKEIW